MQGTWKFKGPEIPESDKTFMSKKDAIIILTIIILRKTIERLVVAMNLAVC